MSYLAKLMPPFDNPANNSMWRYFALRLSSGKTTKCGLSRFFEGGVALQRQKKIAPGFAGGVLWKATTITAEGWARRVAAHAAGFLNIVVKVERKAALKVRNLQKILTLNSIQPEKRVENSQF